MDMNELNAILKLAGLEARPIDEPAAMEPEMGMEPAMSTGCGCETGCGCGMTENEEEFANAPDGVQGKPVEVEVGDETVDLSLRRHIGADAAPVKVQEMVEAYRSFKAEQLDEHCGSCGVGEAEENEASEALIEEVDEDSVRELVLYAENDGTLYQQSTAPIQKNLSKKWVKGIYDHDKAIQLWKYHADRAAKAYGREFSNNDGLKIFSPAVRKAAAEEFANDWKEELEAGNLHETAMVEAVGDAAEEFYRLYTDFAGDEPSGAAGTIIGELVRYLSADDLSDFVETFRSNYDMDEYDAMESAMLSAEEAEAELAEEISTPDYGMFTDEGNEEVDELVNDVCNMVEDGKMSPEAAVDYALKQLVSTAEMTEFEEADDTAVREAVAMEIMRRCGRDSGMDEALDPVGKEDSDIDNDGDTDASDEYLKKRRDAIDSAINEEPKFDDMDKETLDKEFDDEEPMFKDMDKETLDMEEDAELARMIELAGMDNETLDMEEGKYGKKKATEEAKPDFLDLDGDGNKEEDMADAADDAEDEKVNEDHDKYDDAQELYNENGVKVMAYNFAGDSSQFEIYINDEALVDGIKVGDTFHVEGKEYTEVADLVDDYSSLEEGQNYEIKDGEVHISRSDFRRVHKDFKNDEAGNERMSALDPDSGATTSYPVKFSG